MGDNNSSEQSGKTITKVSLDDQVDAAKGNDAIAKESATPEKVESKPNTTKVSPKKKKKTSSKDETVTINNIIDSYKQRIHFLEEQYNRLQNEIDRIKKTIAESRCESESEDNESESESEDNESDSESISVKLNELKNSPRILSAFARPCMLSDALCDFLDVERGTILSRVEVSKLLNAYIQNNNLKDKTNHRIINPDEKLNSILKKNLLMSHFRSLI